MDEYKEQRPNSSELGQLEQASITFSSNIRFNSFMYEPVLDLTKEHLVKLYKAISDFETKFGKEN